MLAQLGDLAKALSLSEAPCPACRDTGVQDPFGFKAASQLHRLPAPPGILDKAWGQRPSVGARKGILSGAGGHQRTLMTSQPQARRRQVWQDPEQLLPSLGLE